LIAPFEGHCSRRTGTISSATSQVVQTSLHGIKIYINPEEPSVAVSFGNQRQQSELQQTSANHSKPSRNLLTMKNLSLIATLLAVRVTASPTQVDKRQISLPPLIPSIPGVTEPIVSGTPPLPIIQVPTPPLPSDPFPVSNIKPKKIGYFWTGAGDNQHADFLVVASLDDASG
jgi:hypothetical protein